MIFDEDMCPYRIDLPHSDYSIFGEKFSVAVPFVREPLGRLFWVNNDWFEAHGVDLSDRDCRQRIENWLVKTFSIRTGVDASLAAPPFVRADRYGGSGGTAHGGSGRCVYLGRFNVKGAGRTPLIPEGVINHTSGELGLTEAVRGSIYGELTHLETLRGAVRTVAVIRLPPFDTPVNSQQCLLIRPNLVRPAHAERSLFFGSSGFAGSDQYDDNLRVMRVRQILAEMGVTWKTMAVNAAEQIGSLDAVRMAQGRFTSSNMSIYGEVIDFDSFRAFDNWFHLRSAKRNHRHFGWDLEDLADATRIWAWKMAKRRIDRNEVTLIIDPAHYRGFAATLASVIPSWSGRRAEAQQKLTHHIYRVCRASYFGQDEPQSSWIVAPYHSAAAYLPRAAALACDLGFDSVSSLVVAGRLQYWRRAHRHAVFSQVNASLQQLVLSGSADDQMAVSAWFSGTVNASRRVYRDLGDGFIPLFVTKDGGRLFVFDSDRRCFRTGPAHGAANVQFRSSRPFCPADLVRTIAVADDESDGAYDRQTFVDWISNAFST